MKHARLGLALVVLVSCGGNGTPPVLDAGATSAAVDAGTGAVTRLDGGTMTGAPGDGGVGVFDKSKFDGAVFQ